MRGSDSSIFSMGRKARLSFSMAAIVSLILGLVLAFAPNMSQRILCTLIGVAITAYGLFNIISYLMDRTFSFYGVELVIGIAAVAFGAFVLVRPGFLIDFLFTVLGFAVLIGSAVGIKRALNLRAFGYRHWWGAMISACCTGLLALSLLLFPQLFGDMATMVIGWIVVIESVSDLLSIRKLFKLSQEVDTTYVIHDD